MACLPEQVRRSLRIEQRLARRVSIRPQIRIAAIHGIFPVIEHHDSRLG